jgi:hypothetical protein
VQLGPPPRRLAFIGLHCIISEETQPLLGVQYYLYVLTYPKYIIVGKTTIAYSLSTNYHYRLNRVHIINNRAAIFAVSEDGQFSVKVYIIIPFKNTYYN